MNPLAENLNSIIKSNNIHIFDMLSRVGKELYYPKGILSQSAEAKEKAYRFNATIGMATEKGKTMHLSSVMAVINGLRPGEALTYAPSFGIMPLREAWKKELVEKNPSLRGKIISLPVVTHAITHGLSVVADMWVDPDDTIVIPDKLWGNYLMIFSVRRGARVVHYPFFGSDRQFNTAAIESCLCAEAKKTSKLIVILNFPNNPTGYSVNPDEANRIADILTNVARNGTNVLAVTDDAYFGLFYENNILKESIFTRLLDRDPRLMAIKLDGATKENYVWGLRIGFVTYGAYLKDNHQIVYDALEKKTAGDIRGSISNASHLGQSVMLKSLKADTYQAEKEEKFMIMKSRALEVKKVLTNPKYTEAWDVYPFNSGYFMCLKLKDVKAETLRVHLLDTYGVGLIALGDRDLRIAFSCIEEEDIQPLFETIFKAVQDLKS